MRLRGQASIELTAVLGIGLIIILFYAASASGILTQFSVQQNYDDAYRSVQALAQAADAVYAQGEGASQEVTIILPTNTDFDSSRTYIGRPAGSLSSPNTVNINLNGTDVYAITRAPLSGSFPPAYGEYTLQVVSHGRHVTISSHLIEAEPDSVHVSVLPGQQKRATFLVKPSTSQRVKVTLNSSWGYANTEMNYSPAQFYADGQSDVPITLSFGAGASAGGTYEGQANVTAYSVDNPQRYPPEKLEIPITLEVS
jgi:uncharacterized protein (UPF0333 family)